MLSTPQISTHTTWLVYMDGRAKFERAGKLEQIQGFWASRCHYSHLINLQQRLIKNQGTPLFRTGRICALTSRHDGNSLDTQAALEMSLSFLLPAVNEGAAEERQERRLIVVVLQRCLVVQSGRADGVVCAAAGGRRRR